MAKKKRKDSPRIARYRSVDDYPEDRMATLLKLAEMLCRDRLTLREAARRLGVKYTQASRIKGEGEDLQIIRTVFHPPSNLALERELEATLAHEGIRKVMVSPRSVPQRAARFFEDEASPGDTVVLDGGHTVREFVQSISEGKVRGLTVMPICADPPSYEISAYELMVVMAVKCRSLETRVRVPYAGVLATNSEQKKARRTARKARFVVLGVGPWKRRFTACKFLRHLGHEPDAVRRKYPDVSAVCGYFAIKEGGKQVHVPEIDKALPHALSFVDLKQIARRKACHAVLMAASKAKAHAVMCAIRAGLCNTLVVDEPLAQGLLDLAEMSCV